jgi:membrane fusion protein, multidrug efflux system
LLHYRKSFIAFGVALLGLLAAGLSILRIDFHPRTDDASVQANYIQFAPEVSGRLTKLAVKDNQYVHKGDLLFTIDSRPYEYVLEQALADQQLLEKQIDDERRKIASESSAVRVAAANLSGSREHTAVMKDAADTAHATTECAQAAVGSAEAQLQLAKHNRERLEPLLSKQYVTVEQVDEARTKVRVAEQSLAEAQAVLNEARGKEVQARASHREASVEIDASQARLEESAHSVDTLDSLIAQRPIKNAHVSDARLNLERCRVVAPFDGYITNLNLAEGEYAQPGTPIFTLIDARNWYVIAAYRETALHRIHPGQHADVYLMSNPGHRFDGHVESIGYGVAPEDDKLSNGLPQIDRTLNWVHLSARFPVRIRIDHPDPNFFRMGITATSIMR